MAGVKNETIEFNQVRGMVRKEILEKYGGISKFLRSDKGKELGGLKMKVYLYDTGPINFRFISSLCEILNIGGLTREVVVSRNVLYRLNTNNNA